MEQQEQNQGSGAGDILLNTFLIDKKRYRVLLNCDKIIWEEESKGKEKTTILVTDIIAVKESTKSKPTTKNSQAQRQPNPPPSLSPNEEKHPPSVANHTSKKEKSVQFLIIYYAKRVINSQSDCNKLRKQAITLYSSDARIISQWHVTLSKILKDQSRPRRILMFINPYGGRGQGLHVYERFCKPLFNLAGIDTSCVISQRANQMRDIIMTQSLEAYDAICCVGGDGTFAEVSNGLIFRAIKEHNLDPLRPEYVPKPQLPIGVVPAGSTDTVAFSMHGTNDERTAAIHIILGQRRGLDMCSICNGNGLIRFCASLLSYGYLGDVALKSEEYRWMGPKRYEYTGAKCFLNNNGYQGEVIILEDESTQQNLVPCSNTDDSICYANCIRCSSSLTLNEIPSAPPAEKTRKIPNGKIFCYDDIVQMQEFQLARDAETLNSSCDKNVTNCGSDSNIEEEKQNVMKNTPTGNSWKSIKGKFFMISGTNLTCSCARSPNGISKYSHLGDGYIDVILVRHTSLLRNLQFVINSLSSKGDIRKLPFVEIYRTKKFFFRAQRLEEDGSASIMGSCQPISVVENSKTSQWNCDGEVINDSDIFMSSHCQLIDIFMRGPHSFDADDMKSNVSGCCKRFC